MKISDIADLESDFKPTDTGLVPESAPENVPPTMPTTTPRTLRKSLISRHTYNMMSTSYLIVFSLTKHENTLTSS
jgi:hypothetical protein